MRVEAFLEPNGWAGVQKQARFAEAAGFDNIATPEIHNDPFTTLTVAALATEKIGLRSAICVAFPRSPMVVANVAWELHTNSGGRACIGLGTQVKGHNERRFSVPWVKPRTRLREYVESLKAIWRCWQTGGELSYAGEFYNFSLMTPEFRPAPNDFAPIPVYTAAVRPRMLEMAGAVADGVRLHGFCTRRYLDDVVLPALTSGLESAGRSRSSFEVCGGGFVATGPTEEAVAKAVEWVRYRVSFYASTRTYSPVMSAHGWDDLAAELHEMSKTGRWKEMPATIPDDVVRAFAAVGTYDQLAGEIERRFGGVTDSVELAVPHLGTDPGALREVIQDIRRIPSVYEAQPGW